MAKIKIQLKNGVVNSYDFANVVKNSLQEENFEFINMGYNPMHDKTVYNLKKDDIILRELGLPRTMTQQEVLCTLNKIKEIKDSYTPQQEEIEFNL